MNNRQLGSYLTKQLNKAIQKDQSCWICGKDISKRSISYQDGKGGVKACSQECVNKYKARSNA